MEQVVSSLPVFIPLKSSLNDLSVQQHSFFQSLSEQVGQWSVYNFGQQLPHRPAMGMIEELAELVEAGDKLDRVGIYDAVADVTIYMADYYSKRGWNMGTAWSSAVRPSWLPALSHNLHSVAIVLIKKLSHHHLKGEQGIRGGSDKQTALMKETCEATLWYLKMVSTAFGADFLITVGTIWSEVSKRDWQKNKNNAHEVAAASIQESSNYVLEGEEEEE